MNTEHWTDRLSEYLDGELAAPETEALEAHLLECPECGRTLRELRLVAARAAQVIDRPPALDLWPGIAARIAEQNEAVVPARKRRISFSVPQLAAAAVIFVLLSASTVYMMLDRAGAPVAATSQGPVTSDRAVAMRVAVESPAAANYDIAIDELERALSTGRARLDTATVRVLESNLKVIDAAIVEAQAALGRDPGNPYLNRYLDQTMQRKIQLLRRATGILRAQT